MKKPEKTSKIEIKKDIVRTSVALSASETVFRYGSANAEFIKGYTGMDNETGQRYAKGLADIARHKINSNPVEAAKNIKQQAGYSAEVATTSRDNAEAIITKSKIQTIRSDDLAEYGRNHNVVDRVQILDGKIIEGSQTQMKFVGNRNQLFKKIAENDHEFSKYRGIKLELPSEQLEGAEQYCRDRAQQLRLNAARAEQKGNLDAATKLRNNADNYDQLATNVRNSGITTEQAIFYREHPKIATVLDIAHSSHRAGIEGAKYGAAIGGSISLLKNLFSIALGEKKPEEAAQDFSADTAKAGVFGYSTALAGSVIKGAMQQSSQQSIRALANTSIPTLTVNICLSLGTSIKRYAAGEITESQLLVEIGEKGSGMLSGSMMAALGQIAIPIPFIGAAIGGMIGYTLSSIFYQSALDAARGAETSYKILEHTRNIQTAAREHIAEEQENLDNFIKKEIPQLQKETQNLFNLLNTESAIKADDLAKIINQFAEIFGKQMKFKSMTEFDEFMLSNESFRF